MKQKLRFLLLTLLTAVVSTAWGEALTETITLSEQGYQDQEKVSSTEGTNFTITYNQGTSNTPPAYYNTGNGVRVYTGGNVVVSSDKTMTKVVFTWAVNKNPVVTYNGYPYSSPYTWEGSANFVQISVGNTGHIRLQKVEVTFADDDTPQISLDPNYPNTISIPYTGTISSEDNRIYILYNNIADLDAVFYDQDQTTPLQAKPSWFNFEFDTHGNIMYTIPQNDGEKRTAYLKVWGTKDPNSPESERIYTDLVTINQEGLPTPVDEYVIDFENEASSYNDWTFTNIISNYSNSGVSAHGDSYYGSTNSKATGSIQTKEKIATPQSLTCYVSKQSTNTSSSTWHIQVSEDGSTWTDVETTSATDMTKGNWKEFTADLSSYTNVYVRIYYSGSTAIRLIDDLTLTTNTSAVANPAFSLAEGEYSEEKTVEITCATEGATIYYSIDGSDPTTEYTGPITISETTTLKAIAQKGDDKSSVVSATYTITISLPDPGLAVTNAPNAMYVGNTVDLAWTSNSTGAVSFSSNNTSVVTVDANGKLTAAAAGTATITVTQAATEEYSAGEVTFTVTVTDPATSTKYVKVTNANQLKAGNEYIIVAEESEGGSYAMGAQSGQYRNAIPVVISNSEVYVNNATDLTLGGKAGMWTLTAENGMLCLVNVPESGGKIESTNNAEATDMQKAWRINEETFTVANRENPYWVIQMNYQEGNPRFACYRNTGNLSTACLYVKDPFTTDDDFHADPLFSIDNIIVEKGDNTRQLVVNTPSDGKPNISFTFDDTSVAEIVNNDDGTYTVNPLAEGETSVLAALPQTSEYESAEFTFTIKVVGQFDVLASDVYQKVTSNDDLTTGKYLIAYEDGSLVFDGNLGTLDAANNIKEVTITDDKIYSHGSYFMIDMEAGTIQSQSGYNIGQTGNSNGLKTSTTESYTNTITIDEDGNAVIQSSGGAYLRYNNTTNNNRFRYYKSTTYTDQQPIQLYKAIVEKNFEFDIAEAATDGTDHYATIADLGLGYFKVNGINGGAVDVYTVVADGDKLSFPVHFSAGEAIPGNGAYLVKGAPGHYKFPATISPDEEVNLGENMLYSTGEGNLSAEDMAAKHDENTKFYKLSLYKGKVGFFYGKADGSAFNYGKGHQAYLAVPAESTGNAAGYFFDGTTTTDISEMPIETAADNATYSISGIRMDSKQLPKGIYIMNGRKVVIK